jgi:hypothetical protein
MVWKPPEPVIMPKKKLTEEELKRRIKLFNKISYSVRKKGINWERQSKRNVYR